MQVNDEVELVAPLGSGSMGAVWKAAHRTLQRPVAVKFIAADLRNDQILRKRFEREAAAAAQIETPHVVEILDQGVTHRGMPFIIMELLEGETLAELLTRVGWLSPRRVAVITTQVAKALAGAHEHGIVHRDIKPENIFLAEQDDELLVKVLDFGVAKVAESCGLHLTQRETVLGTPYYISAEQIQSSLNVTPLADLWSLSVVCYEALTGRVPFDGNNVTELFLAIHDGTHPPPSSVRKELGSATDSWFRRALHREPAERFQSAKELAQSFLSVVATLPDVFDEDEDYGSWLRTGQFALPSIPPSSRKKPDDCVRTLPCAAPAAPGDEEDEDECRATLADPNQPPPVDPSPAQTPSSDPPTVRQGPERWERDRNETPSTEPPTVRSREARPGIEPALAPPTLARVAPAWLWLTVGAVLLVAILVAMVLWR